MEKLNGNHAWAAAVAGVIIWDVFAPETMSSAMDRYLESRARYVAIGAVVLTGAHLLNVFDALGIEKYDPFKAIPNIHPK